MPVTLNNTAFAGLQALPISYQAESVTQGVAARAWEVQGLLNNVDAAALSNLFETWLATRKAENDSLLTGTAGTTVAFTGAAGGRSWSSIACWFDAPPAMDRAGMWWRVSFTVVHAAEAIEALLRGEELTRERADAFAPTFSSITVGTVALTILQEAEGRADGPSVTTAATGADLVEGPLRAARVRNIVGYGSGVGRADFDTLLTWFDTIVATRPAAGTWFPISPPTAAPSVIVDNGVKVSRWLISLQLRLIA